MKKYGVIMAGGVGSRFWPISREKKPKQLLNLTGKDVLINETIDCLEYVVEKDNIYIVANEKYKNDIYDITNGKILLNNILGEPESRGTAACIGYSALHIKKAGDGIMVIIPSDHSIKDVSAFRKTINKAVDLAKTNDKIITIGITPTYPSTGFGYIKFDKKKRFNVLEFIEKPDEENANLFLKSENYLWNSGIVVCKASIILDNLNKYAPEIYNSLFKLYNIIGVDNEYDNIKDLYPLIPRNSFDYAVLESAALNNDVLVVPGDFDWADIGSWDAVSNILEKDKDRNIINGDVITINTTNSIVRSCDKLIATVGVDNLVIIETEDSILVCNKDKSQDVKLILDILTEKKRDDLK